MTFEWSVSGPKCKRKKKNNARVQIFLPFFICGDDKNIVSNSLFDFSKTFTIVNLNLRELIKDIIILWIF